MICSTRLASDLLQRRPVLERLARERTVAGCGSKRRIEKRHYCGSSTVSEGSLDVVGRRLKIT